MNVTETITTSLPLIEDAKHAFRAGILTVIGIIGILLLIVVLTSNKNSSNNNNRYCNILTGVRGTHGDSRLHGSNWVGPKIVGLFGF